MFRASSLLGIALLAACNKSDQSAVKPAPVAAKAAQLSALVSPNYIGSAEMDGAGTITLHLSVSERGMVGDAVKSYRKNDPDYQYILDHVGPLKPGDSVPVRPFPN